MSIFEHIDKRAVIGFGAVAMVLLGAFFYWLSGTGGKGGPITVLSVSPLDATLGKELLSALATLKSTKLDTSIFDDPVFASLKDFGVEIAAQPIGRRNPFAAFDGRSIPAKTSGASTKSPITLGSVGQPKSTLKAPPPETEGFDVD